jgi:hypothetical protein
MPKHKKQARRYWALLQSAGIGFLVAALVALGLVISAGVGATTACSVSGDQCLTAAQPVPPFSAHTPFDSGQSINVVIPANSTFSSTATPPDNTITKDIVECSAPNGVIPTQTSACDGLSVQGPTVLPGANGSLTLQNYIVYALPDSVSLGEIGGPACGQTAATECILYIGDNYNDFTKPHLWSQPFFVKANGNDLGANPGDGSAPTASSVPSASNSTVAAAPASVPADGVNSSTVTVTLLDASSVPVTGKTVTLTPTCTPTPCSTGQPHITGPSPATTDSNGQTTFTVTDAAAQSVTLTAADPADSVTLTHTAGITFAAAATSATQSTVSANPTTVSAGSTTITVTLHDQGTIPAPIVGDTVTLAHTGGAIVTPAATPNKTNAQGVATFTATDATAETVTFTATDATTSTVISNTAAVTFGTLAVSATQSKVTASSPAPLGSTGTVAMVTLLTSTNSPVAGKTVSLQATGSAVVGTPPSATTDSSGQVSFPVTDSVPETVTLTATDTTDGVTLSQKPTVVFQTASPSASASTVVAQPPTAPADGETQPLITVTVKDTFGNPLSGKNLTLQGSPGGNVQDHPIAVGPVSPGVTNDQGIAEFQADDTHAETVIFTATDTTDGNLVLSQTASITFTPGPADPSGNGTTVTADPSNPPADGTTPSTVTVTLTDFFSNPIAGKTIALKALNGSSVITPATAATDQNGQARFSVTDSTAEVVTFQASDTTDTTGGNPTVLDSEAVVKFGNPPAPPPDASYCSVVANPTSLPADGTHSATVSVLLYDNNGEPVVGKAVTLAGASGSSRVAATNATTNSSGMATFAVSDTTAESVRYTATDTTDNIALSALTVSVTFTTAAGSTTTTTTSPSGTTTTTTATNAAASGATSAGSTASGTTGNTGTGSGAPTLAATGAGALLPWLVGFGLLFLALGTIGRRRFKWQQSVNKEHSEA